MPKHSQRALFLLPITLFLLLLLEMAASSAYPQSMPKPDPPQANGPCQKWSMPAPTGTSPASRWRRSSISCARILPGDGGQVRRCLEIQGKSHQTPRGMITPEDFVCAGWPGTLSLYRFLQPRGDFRQMAGAGASLSRRTQHDRNHHEPIEPSRGAADKPCGSSGLGHAQLSR